MISKALVTHVRFKLFILAKSAESEAVIAKTVADSAESKAKSAIEVAKSAKSEAESAKSASEKIEGTKRIGNNYAKPNYFYYPYSSY